MKTDHCVHPNLEDYMGAFLEKIPYLQKEMLNGKTNIYLDVSQDLELRSVN